MLSINNCSVYCRPWSGKTSYLAFSLPLHSSAPQHTERMEDIDKLLDEADMMTQSIPRERVKKPQSELSHQISRYVEAAVSRL